VSGTDFAPAVIVVIGGGPGGYATALYATSAGLDVAIVEKDVMGGTCLNRGCIPAKAFLETAAIYREVAHANDFGIEDSWPIVTEPFMQWVIEDHFCDGRPPFEKVGVQIVKNVKNVEEFEKHKLRLLNGSHAVIAYGGQLAGYKYVHQVMENPLFRKIVWQMMQEEVKPTLPEIPGVDIDQYCRTLIERFSNPPIMDQLPRICLNGTGKIPQFIMPTIAEEIWVSGPFRRLCFTAALWMHYIHGVEDTGNTFEVIDPMLDELRARAKKGDPTELLNIKMLFGDDLRKDKRFMETITTALQQIANDGVLATLPKYID